MASETPPSATEPRPLRVFLSYSHDSAEHMARVLAFALQLRRDGVDARLDQFEAFPPEGWPQWCARQILDARYVVLLCTETYRRRFLGYEPAGIGRGVKWEGGLVQRIIYNEEGNRRFIPALFARDDERFIPETVQGATRVFLDDFGPGDAGYAELVRLFTTGKVLPPLPAISPAPDAVRPDDASILTKEVSDEAGRILAKLDDIRAAQDAARLAHEGHETKSGKRQQVIVGGLAALLLAIVGGAIWHSHSQRQVVTEVHSAVGDLKRYVADPVNLRRRLEEKIEQSFHEKRAALVAANAPHTEVTDLVRWHDRARNQVAEAVAFIVTSVGDPKSTFLQQTALILEERGVDAALSFLDTALRAERQRYREERRQFAEKGRELAQGSLLKAQLHESRLEFEAAEQALREAIDDAPEWWKPHNQLGLVLYAQAQRKAAEAEFEAARELAMADPELTSVLGNLAQVYQDTNRLQEAETLMKQVLASDEQRNGPTHPSVAVCLGNLAMLYKDTNRLAEAEPLMKRALEIDEQNDGRERSTVAIDLNNLALLYHDMDRFAEAEPLMKRALKMDEQGLGADHPTVANRLRNLASLYRDTNRLAEAEPLLKRALAIDKQIYGPNHPAVSNGMKSLADLYQATNRLAEAEPLIERALKIDEQSFGSTHPEFALDLNILSGLYQATNRRAEAESLVKRALQINEQSYGPDDPKVAVSLNNLALLYKDTKRPAEAEPLMQRALKINERSYGSEHSKVAYGLNNLAALYLDMHRLVEAEPLMQRALKIDEQTYGPEHPDVGRDLNNLALLYQSTNRLAEAEPLMRRNLVIILKFTRTTGHPHPNLRAALGNYAELLKAMSRPPEEIMRQLAEAGRSAGFTAQEFAPLLQRPRE
jgi:tetratricopeptide (TPR) repeat protein